MRLALKSALMLTTRVIQIINPELQLHMQRTALIALELALALELPRSQQQTIFCAALLHDIGVLGDKRIVTSLNDIDNIEDPHQHRGAEMLGGLPTFAPVLPVIRHHHFNPAYKGNLEEHIVFLPMLLNVCSPAEISLQIITPTLSSTPFAHRIMRLIRCSVTPSASSRKKSISGCIFIPDISKGCWRSSARLTSCTSISTG